MMCESPDKLQNICVFFIAKNVNTVFEEIKNENGLTVKFHFKNPNACLPSIVSEQLFSSLDENGLTDQFLTIFEPTTTRLQRVFIHDASNLTKKGLSILKYHKISELAVIHLKHISLCDLVDCLGDWTLKNLRVLTITSGLHKQVQVLNTSGTSSECEARPEIIKIAGAVSKLQNLKSLDISSTDFNGRALEMVADNLPALEKLNISNTLVHNVNCLRKWKKSLKILDMYNIYQFEFPIVGCLNILWDLKNLQHLDISDDEHYQLQASDPTIIKDFCEFLEDPESLPQLISLDVSGKRIDAETIKIFLQNHSQMRFLGLFETDVCSEDMFCKPTHPLYSEKLVVSGSATEKQTVESLRRYMRRKSYLKKCLCHLYSFIQNLVEVRLDIIKLVLQSMRISANFFGAQMAATACLYNLTKGGLSQQIHSSWLKQVVDLILVSMENFPKQRQLQRNSLLTLCNDRMLQDVSFNRYHCAELVMNSLMAFDDPGMNRMSVAICSILAAKISTTETSNLGAKEAYMKRLLDIVKAKSEQGEVDIMMKFTLSALWNLTDESPRTCSVFLKLGGMALFLDVLNKFPGESAIETKVLGLLNNIAEVNYLRQHFLENDYILSVKSLLHSEHIDVSYFAAGIVAHIASDGEECWTSTSCSWNEIVLDLGSAVSSWQSPEMEMVAYRSFNPFYSLLSCLKAYQVQLWAAWAINHVCSKNAKRYCHMIIEEGGVEILHNLLEDPATHSSVAEICKNILVFIKENPYSTCTHNQTAVTVEN